jgi:hypothetical protein
MKLSQVTIDASAHEQGQWIDDIPEMGDLRLRVRGIGNADWKRHASKLASAIPREKKRGGIIDPEAQDSIATTCLINACLIDWDGLTDDDDKPIAYSKAKAKELLEDPALRRFRDAVLWAANMAGDSTAAKKEDVAGN